MPEIIRRIFARNRRDHMAEGLARALGDGRDRRADG